MFLLMVAAARKSVPFFSFFFWGGGGCLFPIPRVTVTCLGGLPPRQPQDAVGLRAGWGAGRPRLDPTRLRPTGRSRVTHRLRAQIFSCEKGGVAVTALSNFIRKAQGDDPCNGPQNPKMLFSFCAHYFTNVQWNFPEATGHETSQWSTCRGRRHGPLSSIKPDIKEVCESVRQGHSLLSLHLLRK